MKQSRRPKKTQQSVQRRQQVTLRRFGQLGDVSSIFRRVMAIGDLTLSTTAGGVIATANLASTTGISSAPDFSSCAALYQSYRCVGIKVLVTPFYPVPLAAVVVPAAIYVVPFWDGSPVASIAGALDSSDLKVCSGYKGYTFTIDARNRDLFLDERLWTPTSSTISGAESMGITVVGTASVSTASTPVWKYTVWYDVEFKTAS